jgi:hypothetical protein
VFSGMFGDPVSLSCHFFVRGRNRLTKNINGNQTAEFFTETGTDL